MMALHMTKRERKRQRKAEKKFAKSLLTSAVCSEWEDHEIAKLICILGQTMELSNKKLLRFLNKMPILSAELMACLGDNGIKVKTADVLNQIKKSSNSVDSFIANLDRSFEQGILCSYDPEVLSEVSRFVSMQ